MKSVRSILPGLLLVGGFWTYAADRTTNLISIHLVADKVPRISLVKRSPTPEGLKLTDPPILSDTDFIGWNVTNHTFVITPAAAKRLVGSCSWREKPFVLLANGEPIYVGMFGTSVSSISAGVPTILTDSVARDCFMGITNLPTDVVRMIRQADPGLTDRLLTLTNVTTNVSLRIDAGYPGALENAPDPRNDARIATAVDRLFRKEKE